LRETVIYRIEAARLREHETHARIIGDVPRLWGGGEGIKSYSIIADMPMDAVRNVTPEHDKRNCVARVRFHTSAGGG
jgi:hypothetical protein